MLNVELGLLDFPEHSNIARKVFVAVGDHLLSPLLWEM